MLRVEQFVEHGASVMFTDLVEDNLKVPQVLPWILSN